LELIILSSSKDVYGYTTLAIVPVIFGLPDILISTYSGVFPLPYNQLTLFNNHFYCRLLLFSLYQGLDHYALQRHLFKDISLMQKYLYHLLHGVTTRTYSMMPGYLGQSTGIMIPRLLGWILRE
jgi:hypothetical protein